ncbi:MAG: CDP-paratose 2-epimerase [Pirellula sp.]|nr:CDP-paratose 2-epimerase [Pirellula sp.]
MDDVIIERAPRGWLLRAECVVPRPLDEVFPFFADAMNLERITPPLVRFRVLTPAPLTMRTGLLIDYKLRIRGLPVRWQTEITAWEPQRRFVDEQRRGPYKFWRHEHTFEACDGGTRMTDEVHYGVPGGGLVNWLLVGRDVRKIFAYRQQALREIFF